MLSLLKRKSDAPSGPVVPAWHPNFRDYEKLPDVKVVRTAFFVNGGAVAVLLALATYLGLQELELRELRSQVDAAQQNMDRDKRPSDQAVALFQKFQAEAAKAKEVDAFVSSRPKISDIVLHLTRTLPEDIALDALEVRPTGLVMRMTVQGSPEVAAGHATAYLGQLREDKELTAFDRTKFEFANQARLPAGHLAVEFFLRFDAKYTGGKK